MSIAINPIVSVISLYLFGSLALFRIKDYFIKGSCRHPSSISSPNSPLTAHLTDAGAAAAFLHAASVREADPAPAADRHAAEQPRVDLEAARGQTEAVPGAHHAQHLLRPGLVPPEAESDRPLPLYAVPAVLLAHGVTRGGLDPACPPGQCGAGPRGLETTAQSRRIVPRYSVC